VLHVSTKFDCKTCAYISYVVSEKYVSLHDYNNENGNRNSSVLFFTRLEDGDLRNRGFIAASSFSSSLHDLFSLPAFNPKFLSSGVKRPGREAGHLPPSSAGTTTTV